VAALAFAPDSRSLAAASMDGTVKLWDAETGGEQGTLAGHTHTISSLAFAPGRQTLASGSWDRTVRLWDLAGDD
jgi:WD40 repeat protein